MFGTRDASIDGDRHRRTRRSLAVGLLLASTSCGIFTGCSGLRQRLAHRSAECSQLCEESRQARAAGHDDHADQLLNAAIRRRPTETQARLDLAEELWSSGRQIAAADLLAKMATERPDDAPLLIRLARMEYEIGRTATAEQILRSACQFDPDNPEGIRLKAEIAAAHQDWDTSLATYHRLVQILPDDLNAPLAMAAIHIQRGQSDRAAPMLRTIAQHPQATTAQRRKAKWQLGLCYVHADRWSDAAQSMQAAIQGGPASAEEWYRLAYVQVRMGDEIAAETSLREALSLQPHHQAARELAVRLPMGSDATSPPVVPAGFIPQATADIPRPDHRSRL